MARKKAKNNILEKIIYALMMIVLLSLIILLAIDTYHSISSWQQRHVYFRQPGAEIQSWMTINEISRNFNLSHSQIYSVLGTSGTINNHISLDRFCSLYNKNCTLIVSELKNLSK